MSSPRLIPHPSTPCVIRVWWTSSIGYDADLESPPESWWPPLAGGVRTRTLFDWRHMYLRHISSTYVAIMSHFVNSSPDFGEPVRCSFSSASFFNPVLSHLAEIAWTLNNEQAEKVDCLEQALQDKVWTFLVRKKLRLSQIDGVKFSVKCDISTEDRRCHEKYYSSAKSE